MIFYTYVFHKYILKYYNPFYFILINVFLRSISLATCKKICSFHIMVGTVKFSMPFRHILKKRMFVEGLN